VPTSIKVSCNICGDVRLTEEDVVLRICVDTGESSYWFKCNQCGHRQSKPATPTIVELLSKTDIKREEWSLPLELLERPKEEDLTTISADEIIDLHFELEKNEEDWMNKMVNKKRGE
jgi:uncharacterized Zn finger protein